jgi:hypothetical protein
MKRIDEIEISPKDFETVNWQKVFKENPDQIICQSVQESLEKEALSHEEETSDWKVFALLTAISSFALSNDQDSNEIYLPRFSFVSGRGLIPKDISKEQYETLSEIVDQIVHDDFRARLADVLWLERIGEKPYKFGDKAIDSYLCIIEKLLSSEKDQVLARLRIRRVIHLSREINSRQEEVRSQLEEYVKNGDLIEIVFLELLEILEKYYSNVQIDAEKISRDFAKKLSKQKNYILAIRCWHNNAKWNSRAGDKKAANKALRKIAEINETQAKEAMQSNNFSNASFFWQQAIYQYRKIPGTETEREKCKQELLKCQEKIPEGMTSKSFEINIQEMVDLVKKRIKGRELLEAVLIFGLSEDSPKKDVLRNEVQEIIKDHPLAYLVQRFTLDDCGRTIARNTGFDLNQPDEEFIENEMHALQRFHWGFLVTGYILPALSQFNLEHSLKVEDLQFLIQNNPFVQPGSELLILKGLLAGFKSDFIVSAHILTLQLEGVIRNILNQNGIITSSLSDEGIQEEIDINRLLKKPELDEILGEDLVFDLQGLLVNRHGANFRNRLAHALLSTQDFLTHPSIYLWWISLRILCLPFAEKFFAFLEKKQEEEEKED